MTATPIDRINGTIRSGRPLLLDGGLGSELAARGCDLSSPLWSARLILSDPGQIAQVHRAYLDAGAECIITASYQASIPGLHELGLDGGEIARVFERSVEIAREAATDYRRDNPESPPPLVAASIGPYGAYLADGSEYRGNYGLDDARLREFHAARLALLDRAGADLIACETIPDLQEARVLAQLLRSATTPAWVSFCCRDETRLHDGNPVAAALDLFRDHPRVFALGVNCCSPAIVEPLIGLVRRRASDKIVVVYPNSGEQYDATAKEWHGGQALRHWARLADGWFAAGAGIVGGCCRIGPEYIRELAGKSTWRC